MISWITANIGTIIVSLIVLGMVIAIFIKMRRDKKKGKSSCSCGGGCSSCPMSGKCHSND